MFFSLSTSLFTFLTPILKLNEACLVLFVIIQLYKTYIEQFLPLYNINDLNRLNPFHNHFHHINMYLHGIFCLPFTPPPLPQPRFIYTHLSVDNRMYGLFWWGRGLIETVICLFGFNTCITYILLAYFVVFLLL